MKKENIKNLEDTFKWLDSLDSPDKKDWFKMSEDKALSLAHHGIGTMIRNELKLWFGGSIVPWFNEYNIYHADDMCGIILTSYHRKNNNIDLKLEQQIKVYIDFWNERDPKVNKGEL